MTDFNCYSSRIKYSKTYHLRNAFLQKCNGRNKQGTREDNTVLDCFNPKTVLPAIQLLVGRSRVYSVDQRYMLFGDVWLLVQVKGSRLFRHKLLELHQTD